MIDTLFISNCKHDRNFTQYQNRYAGMAAGVGANSGSNTNLWLVLL